MRKSFISLGFIAAAAFALTNCSNEIEQPFEKPETAGIPFEITASTPDTKTVNDGLSTDWTTGDALNVFHAVPGSDEYVDDGKFTFTSNNSFTGTLASEPTGDVNDWYVFYPYNEHITSPEPSGYITLWNKNGLTQSGNSSMAHLVGQYFPMYGKASIAQDNDVAVQMNHLMSVVKVVVTNGLESDLIVTDVAFTATEDIAGNYYLNIAADPVVYAARPNYVSSLATLEVSNAAPIAAGETAEFYIGVKPFTASAGKDLKLSVNGTEKTITLPKDVTFAPGKIKTLRFNYDQEVLPTEITVDAFKNAEVGAAWYQLEGTITNIADASWGNLDIEDATGSVYVYGLLTEKGGESRMFSTLGLKVGDVVTIVGQRGVHNDNPQMINAYYVSHESCVAAPVISCEENTVTITAETGAAVYYTTDESDPVTSDTKKTYSAPFAINETTVVKAYAVADGKPKSVVVTNTFVVSNEEVIVVLYESFDTNDGTGGNDGSWSGSIASNAIKSDLTWEFTKGGGAYKCAKFGTGSAKGVAVTPALGDSGNMTLTFKAGAWSSDSGTTLTLSIDGGASLNQTEVTMQKGAWTEYAITITGATENSKITFAAKNKNNNRFFLDEVKVFK